MDLAKCTDVLLGDTDFSNGIPPEALETLRNGSNAQYLDTLSHLALNATHTIKIFATHEPIFLEVCSRWLLTPDIDDMAALAAIAKVIPSAPYLSAYARKLLNRKRGTLRSLASSEVVALNGLPLERLRTLLLTLHRLVTFDNQAFAPSVPPAQLQVLLRHLDPSIRYLTIRLLCLYMHASDAALLSMSEVYIGDGVVPGPWEEETINYTFFSLWEAQRCKNLESLLEKCRGSRASEGSTHADTYGSRCIESHDFSATVACIGGILLPRADGIDVGLSTLTWTKTTLQNACRMAESVKYSKSTLVTGFPGAGKTSVIRDVARELGKSSTMVTLHLNEQTDAKLLIGMYTSSKTPGSFCWRPGILTTAVMQGWWVVIEDLDRAPQHILSMLLPLLERRELFVSHWAESVQAAPDFKLIATVRSQVDSHGKELATISGMIGLNHWAHVPFRMLPDEELSDIALDRYPLLTAYIPSFMNVYHALKEYSLSNNSNSFVISRSARSIGPDDFLRWCSRVQGLLSSAGITMKNHSVPDNAVDNIFLEAIDCFTGFHAPGPPKDYSIDLIAQNLHIPSERALHCLYARKADYRTMETTLRVGRVSLLRARKSRGLMASSGPQSSAFATPDHVVKMLESLAVTVKQAEPCLLVGETGTGKTSLVQHLADVSGQKLTVINLSQQSDASDLLGGYKPLNVRSLALPLKEEFDDLLTLTSTSDKNQTYIAALAKFISKGRWAKALKLWQDTLRVVEQRKNSEEMDPNDADVGQPQAKKRRLQSSRVKKLRKRWEKFAADVEIFKLHLASGSKGFAFSFVEGNIIKAARNGEWVLLDEISLAPTDTLESIADLLSRTTDDGPSVLLTDSGDTERVYAHADFRLFSAMNPATDIGKRDLPLSIRSKFTELYVSAPDNDLVNLVTVVQSYLGNHVHLDVRAASDIARLYLDVKKLLAENKLVDGAKQKPHFSLRTLTRTLIYILDIAPIYGLRRAMLEGFSMSYLTVLDNESELLLQPLIEGHILGEEKNSRVVLNQTPRLPHDRNQYVQFKHYWIVQGASPVESQAHYVITPFVERNLLNLVRATSTRRFPVLLQGPTSSGKTSMVDYLARISGNKLVRINNHEHTDIQEYLGTYVSDPEGRLIYQEGVLVQALRQGSWVVLDELNLAPTDVLEALNRLLDDNRELFIPETQQTVRPHKDFMLFATQNPPGIYGGRKLLSRAFRNRFLELHFSDIPETELETILCERSQIAPSFCSRIVAVYKRLSILRQSGRLFEQKDSFATLRDLFRWALRDANDREQLAVNGFLLLAERVRKVDERLAVKKVIEDVMNVNLDEEQIYSSAKTGALPQISSAPHIVWTKSMRRLYVLVTEALKNKEPVLLVGETGSGKTTICQYITKLKRKELYTVNAHQNMETSDVLGAQRPVRNKSHAEAQLAEELKAALEECHAYRDDHVYSLTELLEAYDGLQSNAQEALTEDRRIRIEKAKIKTNSLFEWANGSLVNALHDGQHFLLDEISLADDSVLERLNSVLEPGRTLFIAEKGTSDALFEAAPGFQFLATMNPGGDYGKRELSPALRNRFTEIWVPNLSSETEILEIVQNRLTPKLASFCNSMVAFAVWFSTKYNPTGPFYSIRDILCWIEFVNTSQMTDPRLSLLHGAAMVYIDSLGANPSSQLSIPISAVPEERRTCISKLGQLFNSDFSCLYREHHRLWFEEGRVGIGPFSIVKTPRSRKNSKYSLQAPTTVANAMKIIRALQLKRPILIEGSPGVGKTTLVAALAELVGVPLVRINLSDQTDLMDLFGSDVPLEGAAAGQFVWRDAPFLRAMQKGEWVLLDEMNLASQSVLEGLNSCLDHRGQVFVSELDRTFERHPNFVIFAAQNPHYQGGGRKGLPVSFVNRFTTVYADTFTPDDLKAISTELFPTIASDHRTKILNCVTTLNRLLEDDGKVGAHGAPWEINLRDILRWLHLLTARDGLMPYSNLTDFQSMLLLQRFRTAEDVSTVTQVLQQHLSEFTYPSYFHNKSPSLLGVGLGLLPRDELIQSRSTTGLTNAKADILFTQSVMLCVQNNWPCLLVGGPGSAKSSLIVQLAGVVGANVTEISMNSEMDAMDLIGAYEQADPQREIAGFVKRLQDWTRRTLIWEVGTQQTWSEDLTTLEKKLQAVPHDLSDILQSLQCVAVDSLRINFDRFLKEGQSILDNHKADNRARFLWVDGIILKALKQGRWVVLDNANLCSPSVLDRLNSLLEPKGFLSVNEHRNPDGSAEVVHPHRDFRIFMTMDPRHGELSRAMRNRSIELFIPDQPPRQSPVILSQDCDSCISMFNQFQNSGWDLYDDTRFRNVLYIFLDHLTFSDLKACRQWEAQIALGLGGLSTSKKRVFSFVLKAYRWMIDHNGSTLNSIKDVYESFGQEIAVLSDDFASIQTIHPYNNTVLLRPTDRNSPSSNLRWLGACFELLVELYSYLTKLMFIDQNLYADDKIAPWTPLERSMISIRTDTRFQTDSTRPIAAFLQETGLYLRRKLEIQDFDDINDRVEGLNFSIEVLAYLQDLLNFMHSQGFSDDVFQAYYTIGRSISKRVETGQNSRGLALCIARELHTQLDRFKPAWQLSSGLAMERLWSILKPDTAQENFQLDMSLRLEAFCDQFDKIKWSSRASMTQIEHLLECLVRVRESIHTATREEASHFIDAYAAIGVLQTRSDVSAVELQPWFQSQFDIVYQYEAWPEHRALISSSLLGMLAGRPIRGLINSGGNAEAYKTLGKLKRLAMGIDPSTKLASFRGIFAVSLLHKMTKIGEVPLHSFRLLGTEMDSMIGAVSNSMETLQQNPFTKIHQTLGDIRKQVKPTSEVLEESSNQTRSQIVELLRRFVEKGEDLDTTYMGRIEFLQLCLESTTNLEYCEATYMSQQPQEEYANCAIDWIRFFTGCLIRYVPDRPFDPALRPKIEQMRNQRRKTDLEDKLRALQDFELVSSGETSTFRTVLAERSIQASGVGPQKPSIVRPPASDLSRLQVEFNNVLNVVLSASPDSTVVRNVSRGHASQTQQMIVLRTNIGEAIRRLSQDFHAYKDITDPLIAFLQGLDVGLAFSLIAGNAKGSFPGPFSSICRTTPFLGAGPQDLVHVKIDDLQALRTTHFDTRIYYLKCISLTHSVTKAWDLRNLTAFSQVHHSLYEAWKEGLEHGQHQNAAKSSLYRYRGSEKDDNEKEEEEFQQLFPSYEHPPEEDRDQVDVDQDPRQQALSLAQIQRDIFQCSQSPSEKLLQHLRNTSTDISILWSDDSGLATSPVPAEVMLSALVIQLDEKRELPLGKAPPKDLYNFYVDPNLQEVQKIITLVHKIQARFTELQQAWQEHATLGDVLKTSSELLGLRHTEPVAKLITKAEQLHGFIHEWQVVASTQYTAATLYDQLTDLLISWRRLELSTWARLFDMEDQKCYDDADSWWFIAYEVIIAAPLSIIHAGEDVRIHVEDLFRTLSELIMVTSLGQYVHRLDMITNFQKYIELLEKETPSMTLVRNALTNFLSYYSRFKMPVQEALLKGRQALEKDIKEIVLLASWKDTNIIALRDSAKRSHHKLFKVIRKYRLLLAEQAETILNHGLPQQIRPTNPRTSPSDPTLNVSMVPQALRACEEGLATWQMKPDRFKNPVSTAELMLSMSQPSPNTFDVVSHLTSMGIDLVDSMKALQKETPPKATEDNQTVIKHLKARKRKLYADTLKAIRHMGLRSNLSADALAKQASIAVVLANTPTLVSDLNRDDLQIAEFHFHKVVSTMLEARERSRDHSEDLSNGEVARSVGYLESMESMMMKQRIMLANTISNLQAFDKTIKKIQNLWAPDTYVITEQDAKKDATAKELHHVLKWLPSVLEAGCIIIEKYSNLADADCSTILSGLEDWKRKSHASLKAFDELPELSVGLSTSRHAEVTAQGLDVTNGLKNHLHLLIKDSTNLSFVFKQLILFTSIGTGHIETHTKEEQHYSIQMLDDDISAISDSILVAVQHKNDALSRMPASDGDSSWLTHLEESQVGGVKSLHLQKINEMAENLISKIACLDPIEDRRLSIVGALCAMALPIFQQYRDITAMALIQYLQSHRSLCEFTSIATNAFNEIALKGFCSPTENPGEGLAKEAKVEGGTGLGEGEGVEDISKDVQDDEDISELAQEKKKDEEKGEHEKEESAIDMDHDEMEGELGESSDKGEEDESASEAEQDDMDEEIGSIDDLDPSAVDQKLWDGIAENDEKETQGSKPNNEAGNDEQVAGDTAKRQEEEGRENEAQDANTEEGAEEDEALVDEKAEETGVNAQEGQNLELPEEMDLDRIDDTDSESLSVDSDRDATSDTELQQDLEEQFSQRQSEDSEEKNIGAEDAAAVGSPMDTDPSDEEQDENQHGFSHDRSDNAAVDPENAAPSDVRGLGDTLNPEQDDESKFPSQAQVNKGAKGKSSTQEDREARAEDGELGPSKEESGEGQAGDGMQDEENINQPFKKLGDALEKWLRQSKEIREPTSEKDRAQAQVEDVDMADHEFEHLRDEEQEGDTQALGATTNEQARALDEQALESELCDEPNVFSPEVPNEEAANGPDEIMDDLDPSTKNIESQKAESRPSKLVANNADLRQTPDHPNPFKTEKEEDINDLDTDLSTTHLQPKTSTTPRSPDEARRLWSHYEALTRDLSTQLTEQLRLILLPTQATKMRGDFRTGKRLNIKRIIPYIASNYKRDKIWMRRTIPSKRKYQIMLAIDDSKSMGEGSSGSGHLAFQTLALVAKSLSMLEAGEICIVGFGEAVHVAHDFSQPFSSESGAQALSTFTFQQPATNIRRLVETSITLFRDARRRQSSSSAEADLWQLQLIISDGICQDHASIQQLVRQAQEERIMIVFVIVDAAAAATSTTKESGGGGSIVDMTEAVFEPDPVSGESKLRMKRYLDGFPFPYYLVLGDVRDMPGVLAQAVRQWFEEVVGMG